MKLLAYINTVQCVCDKLILMYRPDSFTLVILVTQGNITIAIKGWLRSGNQHRITGYPVMLFHRLMSVHQSSLSRTRLVE